MSMMTIRLDPSDEREVIRLALERKTSKSQVVREAIRQFAAAAPNKLDEKPRQTLYDRWKRVIGIAKGPRRYSAKQVREAMRDYLMEKKRQGRL